MLPILENLWYPGYFPLAGLGFYIPEFMPGIMYNLLSTFLNAIDIIFSLLLFFMAFFFLRSSHCYFNVM